MKMSLSERARDPQRCREGIHLTRHLSGSRAVLLSPREDGRLSEATANRNRGFRIGRLWKKKKERSGTAAAPPKPGPGVRFERRRCQRIPNSFPLLIFFLPVVRECSVISRPFRTSGRHYPPGHGDGSDRPPSSTGNVNRNSRPTHKSRTQNRPEMQEIVRGL